MSRLSKSVMVQLPSIPALSIKYGKMGLSLTSNVDAVMGSNESTSSKSCIDVKTIRLSVEEVTIQGMVTLLYVAEDVSNTRLGNWQNETLNTPLR